ncbi:hypothetical protein GGG16DRAFT_107438 [Schizophyllum commune]
MLAAPAAAVCHDMKPSSAGNPLPVISQQPRGLRTMTLVPPTKDESAQEQAQAARLRGGRRGCFMGNIMCV